MGRTVYPFRMRNGAILLQRYGPINMQKQNTKTDRQWGGHRPPVNRGMWAFPFPTMDLFFAYHRITNALPRKYRLRGEALAEYLDSLTDSQAEEWHAEKERLEREIINRPTHRLKTFWWHKPLYSHIFPQYVGSMDEWYLYERPYDFALRARHELRSVEQYQNGIMFINYASDHLEVFLPGV